MLTPHIRRRGALPVEFKFGLVRGGGDRNAYICFLCTRKRTTNILQATRNSFFGRVCPRRLRPRPHARAARFTPTSRRFAPTSACGRRRCFSPVIVRLTRRSAGRWRPVVDRGWPLCAPGEGGSSREDGPSSEGDSPDADDAPDARRREEPAGAATGRSRVGEEGTTVDGGELGPPGAARVGQNAGRAGVGHSRAAAWAAGASREGTGRAPGDECCSTSAGGCRLPAFRGTRASAVSADPRQCGAF